MPNVDGAAILLLVLLVSCYRVIFSVLSSTVFFSCYTWQVLLIFPQQCVAAGSAIHVINTDCVLYTVQLLFTNGT